MISLLLCPFCGGGLGLEAASGGPEGVEYGLLNCQCGQYPVLAGIPVLKKNIPPRIFQLVETRQYREALLRMLVSPMPSSWLWKASRALSSVKPTRPLGERIASELEGRWRDRTERVVFSADPPPTARELLALYFLGTGWKMPASFDYFFYRFGQPRHLVGLSFARLVDYPDKPVLDLACGAGHLTRYLQMRARPQPVIGVDHFFYLLYVAKTLIAPYGEYVCCNAESTLPFPDETFSHVYCSDAFFDFTSKLLCARELKRVAAADGTIMLIGLRNALLSHLYPGRPMTPEGYRSFVADWPHRMIADADVLERYLKRQGYPLGASAPLDRLNTEPLISIVASRREEVFRDHGPFEVWPHGEGRLGLNPLYIEEGRTGTMAQLRRAFPSAFYEEENQECKTYLPETAQVRAEGLEALRRGERTAEVESLVNRFVAVGMPERYL